METFAWSPALALGIPQMDMAHHALLVQMQRLADGPDNKFADGFGALIDSLERDFREEEEVMEQICDAGLHEHREQHARVLAGLHHADPHVMAGDIEAGRGALRLLAFWFYDHLDTLDRALAAALGAAGSESRKARPDGGLRASSKH